MQGKMMTPSGVTNLSWFPWDFPGFSAERPTQIKIVGHPSSKPALPLFAINLTPQDLVCLCQMEVVVVVIIINHNKVIEGIQHTEVIPAWELRSLLSCLPGSPGPGLPDRALSTLYGDGVLIPLTPECWERLEGRDYVSFDLASLVPCTAPAPWEGLSKCQLKCPLLISGQEDDTKLKPGKFSFKEPTAIAGHLLSGHQVLSRLVALHLVCFI